VVALVVAAVSVAGSSPRPWSLAAGVLLAAVMGGIGALLDSMSRPLFLAVAAASVGLAGWVAHLGHSTRSFDLADAALWTVVTLLVIVRLLRTRAARYWSPRWRLRFIAGADLLFSIGLWPGRPAARPAAVAGAVLLFAALAPPAWLRRLWRQSSDHALRQAELELMQLRSPDDLARVVLPRAVSMLGGEAGTLLDRDGAELATHGVVRNATRRGAVRASLGSGWLVVHAGPLSGRWVDSDADELRSLASSAAMALQASSFQKLATLANAGASVQEIVAEVKACALRLLPISDCEVRLSSPDDNGRPPLVLPDDAGPKPVRVALEAADARRIGTIVLRVDYGWSPAELHLAQTLAQLAGPAVAHAQISERERDLAAIRFRRRPAVALVDELTGVGARRAWSDGLAEAEQRYAETGRTAAVLVVGLDELGSLRVNGQAGAEQLLRRAAAVLRAVVNGDGLLCRLGGNEFGILVPDVDQRASLTLAQRVGATLQHEGIRASVGQAMRSAEGGLEAAFLRALSAVQRSSAQKPAATA
jgi:diguanylate cyclase (GGDEF)-like protein